MPTTNNHPSPGANSAPSLSSVQEASLTFANLSAILRRRWIWIAVSLMLGIGLAIAYLKVTAPTFESSAQLLVMRKDPRLAAAGVQASNESESKVSEDLLATHIQLVQSRRMISEALTQRQLDKLPSIVNALGRDQTATKFVIDSLLVTRGGVAQAKNAHVLNIAFRHKSDVDAQKVLQAIIDRYQEFLAEKFQDVNTEAADLIAKAQKELAQQLEDSEEEYRQFREKTPLLWNGDQTTNVHRLEYDQIQSEMSQLQLQATESKSRYELVESTLKEMEVQGASDLERLALIDEKNAARIGVLLTVDQGKAQTAQFQATMPDRTAGAQTEFQTLLALVVKEKSLSQDFGSEHPEVKTLREQIKQTQDFLTNKNKALGIVEEEKFLDPKELVYAYVKLLGHDLNAIERRYQQLEKQAAKAEEAAKGLITFELQGESLRKQLARQQELYDAVVDRLRDINLAKDYGGFINEVISPAEVGLKIWPSVPIVLALGLLLGFVVGCGGAAIGESLDRSFRNPDEIHNALGLPILSHIPNLVASSKRKSVAAKADSALDSVLLTYFHPKSRESEIFRGLRTSLFFNTEGKRLQVIECTSPNQGDGKSTLAANLAVSIAQTNRSVLLVDCDMRRPRLHEMFALQNTIGLADIIGSEAEPWDAIQATEIEKLSVLPCGTVPDNPAELLTSPKFESFLALIRERFDYIILDCPPILAVADPCIIAPRVDGVVLAVRISKDSRPQALRAKQLLAELAAPVLGVVVNCCDAGTHYGTYGYGSGYGSTGGYGYGNIYGEKNSSYYDDAEVNDRPRQKRAQRV
jgi:succinoglycan biosynthesis transport protein ExoP